MVVIRLARHGAHKSPYYRIVVADQRRATSGSIIEQVGTYDPRKDPSEIHLDVAKAEEWISKGAQPSETVAKLIAIATGETPAPAPEPAKPEPAPEPEAAEEPAEEPAAEEAAAEEPAAEEPEPEAAPEPEAEDADAKDGE